MPLLPVKASAVCQRAKEFDPGSERVRLQCKPGWCTGPAAALPMPRDTSHTLRIKGKASFTGP